jgi:hypothetical protein
MLNGSLHHQPDRNAFASLAPLAVRQVFTSDFFATA